MPSCLIKGCFNTWKQKEGKVILHVFPRDKDGIRLWLNQSPENFPNVEELVEKIYSQNAYGTVRLCSKHFNDDQYFHEGTKRRLRPNAIPTIFTIESPPSKTSRKGIKRKKKTDLTIDVASDGAASSGVLFYAQNSDGSNTLVQQILPSHLQIVLPSTSLLEKPKMVDKAVNTDAFFSKKCQAVGTDPMLGKKSTALQTKPWKGKSQGVLCTILTGDTAKSDQGTFQHRGWQTEKFWANNIRFPTTSKTGMGQVGSTQTLVSHSPVSPQATFTSNKNETDPISRDIKVEKMSRRIDYGHSSNSIQDGQTISEKFTGPTHTSIVRPKEEDDSESESTTDEDSEKEDLPAKNTSDKVEGLKNNDENEAKFTVLQSCLYDLIKLVRCQYRDTCHAPLTNVQVKTLGSVVAIDVLCSKGHNSTLWHSQTLKSKTAAGSLLPASGSPSQQFAGGEIETFFHNLEYDDDEPPQ